MELIRQKNIATYIYFPLVDEDGDPVSSAGSLDSNIDAWSDGTAPNGFVACTNEATEIGSTGCYYLLLSAAEMNHDYIMIYIASTNAKTQWILINTIIGDPSLRATTAATDAIKTDTAAILLDTDTLEADLKTYLDAIETNLEGDIEDNDTLLDTIITAIGNLHNLSDQEVWEYYSRTLTGTINDFDELDTALDAAHGAGNWEGGGAAPTVGEIDTQLSTTHGGGNWEGGGAAPTVGEIADAVWDEVISQGVHDIANSAAEYLKQLWATFITRIAQCGDAGSSNTIDLDAGASAVSDFYKGQLIFIGSGTGKGQARTCLSYNGTTKIATVTPNWATAPDGNSWFAILNTGSTVPVIAAHTLPEIVDAIWDEAIAAHTTGTTFGGKNQKVVPSETINDYKADISGLATEANATTNKTAIITEIDANETKIDTMISNILRLQGLNGEFLVAEYTFTADDNITIQFWQYDTEGNFNTHNKSTGLIGSWIINTTYASNKPTIAKSKRLS